MMQASDTIAAGDGVRTEGPSSVQFVKELLVQLSLIDRCRAVLGAFPEEDDRIELMAWIDGKEP
jgi:hypothetical protein